MLCCICLLECSDMSYIFNESGQDLNIAEIIGRHLWFKPQPDDELSAYVCNVCWETLNSFHEFYQQVEKIHAKFQTESNEITVDDLPTSSIKVENDKLFVTEIDQLKVENDYKATRHKMSEKADYLEKADNQQQNNMDSISPIQEYPLDNLDIRYADNEMKTENHTDSDAFPFEPFETSEPELSSDEEQIKKGSKNKVKKKGKCNKEQTNQLTKKSKSTTDVVKKKRKFEPGHTEAMIQKHIPMGCNLCVFVGKKFQDIIEHFEKDHPKVRPYITCCDKKLTKRFYIAQHALRHENPNCFKCQDCNKIFTSGAGLRTHKLTYHIPDEELTFACDMCEKKFATQYLLDRHTPSHIPREEWQYFCTECPTPKYFASSVLLGQHIRTHRKSKHVCHVCAKEIQDTKAFEKHVRSHFDDNDSERVQCPYPDCGSVLKDKANLRKHMQRHNPEGLVYPCQECGKVFKSPTSLSSHKFYYHKDHSYPCEVCHKTFKKALALKEHMTQHTGETLYGCPFCTKTFNSSANMHAHKKHQHPIEWEEQRKNKRGGSQVISNS